MVKTTQITKDSDLNAQTITELHKMYLVLGTRMDDGISSGNQSLIQAANLVRRDIVFHIESLEKEAAN